MSSSHKSCGAGNQVCLHANLLKHMQTHRLTDKIVLCKDSKVCVCARVYARACVYALDTCVFVCVSVSVCEIVGLWLICDYM